MQRLYPYQEDGVIFLKDGYHKLLADDMGLGKTAQAIVASKDNKGRILIVCPSSVKYGWMREIIEWADVSPDKIFIYTSGADGPPPKNAKYIIINYELIINGILLRQLKAFKYETLICDEAHYLKSLDSQRSVAVLGKNGVVHNALNKYLLTGTPILNRPIELYAVLKTLCPSAIAPYSSYVEFGKHYCAGYRSDYDWNFKGASNVEELKEKLTNSGFMLRREKQDVMDQLPPVVENYQLIDCGLNYAQLEEEPVATSRRLVATAKTSEVINHVNELMQTLPKLTIFTYHRELTEMLIEKLHHLNPVSIYGGTTAEQKQKAVDTFVNNEECRLFIGQIKSAGQGIDGLQKVCNYVIFAEIDWSPGVIDQARDRLRRIGQNKTVFITYMIAKGSVEERIISTVGKKRAVINKLMKPDNVIRQKGKVNLMSNSLEQAIVDLTKAINTLSHNLCNQAKGGKSEDATEAKDNAPKKPGRKPGRKPKAEAEQVEQTQATVEAEAEAEQVEQTQAAVEAEEETKAVEYTEDDVRVAAKKAMGASSDKAGNKAKVKELISEFAATIDQVPVEERGNLIEKLDALAVKIADAKSQEDDDDI